MYFIASKLLRELGSGPTLLISPLLSLMRNQVEAAERIGIRAARLDSETRKDWEAIESRLSSNDVDVLLVSPERLAKLQTIRLGDQAERLAWLARCRRVRRNDQSRVAAGAGARVGDGRAFVASPDARSRLRGPPGAGAEPCVCAGASKTTRDSAAEDDGE